MNLHDTLREISRRADAIIEDKNRDSVSHRAQEIQPVGSLPAIKDIRSSLYRFYFKWNLKVDAKRCKHFCPIELKPDLAVLSGVGLWTAYATCICKGHMSTWPYHGEHYDLMFDFGVKNIPLVLYDPDVEFDTHDQAIADAAYSARCKNMYDFAHEFLNIIFDGDEVTSSFEDDFFVNSVRVAVREGRRHVEYYHIEAFPGDGEPRILLVKKKNDER